MKTWAITLIIENPDYPIYKYSEDQMVKLTDNIYEATGGDCTVVMSNRLCKLCYDRKAKSKMHAIASILDEFHAAFPGFYVLSAIEEQD